MIFDFEISKVDSQEFVFLSIDQKQDRKRRFLISLLEIVVFSLVFGLWIEIQTPVVDCMLFVL